MSPPNAPEATGIPAVDLEAYIYEAAAREGVKGVRLYHTLYCESGLQPNIQSSVPDPSGPNGREDSWGIAQIHLPSHPEVSRENALDPIWAIDWAAYQFSQGNARWWTCWRLLYL